MGGVGAGRGAGPRNGASNELAQWPMPLETRCPVLDFVLTNEFCTEQSPSATHSHPPLASVLQARGLLHHRQLPQQNRKPPAVGCQPLAVGGQMLVHYSPTANDGSHVFS